MPLPPATAVVVIAHGSRNTEANDAHRTVCLDLAERLGGAVAAAFLELAEPDLATAVDTAVDNGAERVLVVPLFLYPGRHSRTDIPALVAASRERHPTVDIMTGDLFGADPTVVDLLAEQVDRALA